MLKYRAISFPMLMGILWAIFFAPPGFGKWVFSIAAVLMIGMATYECARMMDSSRIMINYPLASGLVSGVTLALLLLLNVMDIGGRTLKANGYILHMMSLSVLMIPVLLSWVFVMSGGILAARKAFGSMTAVAMTVVPFGMVTLLYFPHRKFLLFVILVTKAMDTGGYIFGMLSGKYLPGGNHKLCPSISPKKSWEGAAGGILLSVATALVLTAVFRGNPEWKFCCNLGRKAALWNEPFTTVVFTVLLALASIAGDLTESALKRKCGVKDSGTLIPGMGGPLDVLDSFIYVAPVCFVFSSIVR